MKAITIWQPWASLLACGAKKFETRPWATKYRGPIAIHAAATPFKRIIKKIFPLHEWEYAPDYSAKRRFVKRVSKFVDIDSLCYGAIIATGELMGCYKIGDSSKGSYLLDYPFAPVSFADEKELMFGDWTPGRYAWEITNVKILDNPIPEKGAQRLWTWDAKHSL
ncbi:MAG: hypothetical protein ACK5JF_14430 [Oscillospiraceae bacterium]